MKDHRSFFAPYRQRISQMYQQHDTFEEDENQHWMDRHYSPYHQKRSYSPSPQNNFRFSQKSGHQPRYQQFLREKTNKRNKTSYVEAKMKKEMHQPLWENLYNQGKVALKEKMEKFEERKNLIDIECTFTPNVQKSRRYGLPTSNFLERNNIWQENKINKIVLEKEEEVVKDLEDCTFKPKINANYKLKSNKYSYKNLKTSKSAVKFEDIKDDKKDDKKEDRPPKKAVTTRRPQANGAFKKEEVGKIMNLIRSQLKKIEL